MWRWMLNRFYKKRSKVWDESGLSLIEIVIILVILSIVIVPLGRLSVRNMTSGGMYATMTKAISYAQEWVEQIIADYAADDAGRGYDWVRTNWSGSSDTPDTGLSRSVAISGQGTLNGVTYVVVTVTVSGTGINNVVLTTWLVDNS